MRILRDFSSIMAAVSTLTSPALCSGSRYGYMREPKNMCNSTPMIRVSVAHAIAFALFRFVDLCGLLWGEIDLSVLHRV